MIRIKYKSGWIRFKTTDELVAITGWPFDKIVFALKTKTSIRGVEIAYGNKEPKTRKTQMKSIRTEQPQPRYKELKNQLRMVKKRKNGADRIIKRYEESWFVGRVETNEIKHARTESKRLQFEVDQLKKSIEHYKRYVVRRRPTNEYHLG